MIQVTSAAEPPNFNNLVRVPGNAFLRSLPTGVTPDWRRRDYWRKIIPELHSAYGGICAYTCHYIPEDTGSNTVEHFQPKKLFPNDAYEWSNYRLVCGRMNGRKGDHQDVVDPFVVVAGMFELDFPSLQVAIGSGLSTANDVLARSTRERLKLNDDVNIRARLAYVLDYRHGHIARSHITSHAPFIDREMTRQNITRQLLAIMFP